MTNSSKGEPHAMTCVMTPNYELERSVKCLRERAAGAPEEFAPAARWNSFARPAQRGRQMSHTAWKLLVAAGVFNLAFAIFHMYFWRLFDWHQELPRLGLANRGIMQVLNLCLTYVFVVAAVLLLSFPTEAFGTELGRFLLTAMTGFWLLRTILQPLFFGMRHPLSKALFALFALGTVIHGVAWSALRDV